MSRPVGSRSNGSIRGEGKMNMTRRNVMSSRAVERAFFLMPWLLP